VLKHTSIDKRNDSSSGENSPPGGFASKPDTIEEIKGSAAVLTVSAAVRLLLMQV
jgi:hypothetical protein